MRMVIFPSFCKYLNCIIPKLFKININWLFSRIVFKKIEICQILMFMFPISHPWTSKSLQQLQRISDCEMPWERTTVWQEQEAFDSDNYLFWSVWYLLGYYGNVIRVKAMLILFPGIISLIMKFFKNSLNF